MTYVKKCSDFMSEMVDAPQVPAADGTAPAEAPANPQADAAAYSQAKAKVSGLFNGNMDEKQLQDAFDKASEGCPNMDALNFHFATKKLEAQKIAMETQVKTMMQQLAQRTTQLAQIEKAVQA